MAKIKMLLNGQSGFVRSLAVLNNGDLASGTYYANIRIWNIDYGCIVMTLSGHSNRIWSLAVLNNGYLASGSSDQTINIWDTNNGSLKMTLNGHTGTIRSLAALDNGDLASGSDDSTIRIWDTNNGNLKIILTGHSQVVLSLAVLKNSDLASGSGDSKIKIWNTNNGSEKITLNGHLNSIRSLAVLKNGDLASGSDDNTIKIWNVNDGSLLMTLTGHSGGIWSLAILKSGDLASGSFDGTIKIWNTNNESLIMTLTGHTDVVYSLAVLNHGDLAKFWKNKKNILNEYKKSSLFRLFLIKLIGTNVKNSLNQIFTRLKHRNHPGHKPKPPAISILPSLPDNYVDEATYPPVKPKLPPGEFSADYDPKLAWLYYEEGQKYTALKTIQERLSVLAYSNVQQTLDDLKQRKTRFFPIYKLSSLSKTPKMLPFNQYITKTHVQSIDEHTGLASSKDSYQKLDYNLYEMVRSKVKEIIVNNYQRELRKESIDYTVPVHEDTYRPEVVEKRAQVDREHKFSNLLIRDILNFMTSALGTQDSNWHLLNAQYGVDVDIKSYWKRSGFASEKPRGAVYPDTDTIRFQYEDIASYQIKCSKPLRPLYQLNHPECSKKINDFVYKPVVFKLFADHILPMQVPGHWYGDKREFNFMTVFNTTRMNAYLNDLYPDYDYKFEFLKSMAITSAHAELTAQAYYLGFSMWKDLTYPLVGQFVFTDGKHFSLCNYQLNTLRLWNKATSLTNLCYLSEPQVLFELNEDKSEIKHFNDELFNKLVNCLLARPVEDEGEIVPDYSQLDHMVGGTALRPYLSVQNFEQLSERHQLLAISLYELVKYDKPVSYLNLRSVTDPVGMRPKFQRLYDKYTYEFRDIVLNYYPRDYYGFRLVDRMLKRAPKQTGKFWDLKHPVLRQLVSFRESMLYRPLSRRLVDVFECCLNKSLNIIN
ncbi:vegetative incompatibility WD repeat [Brachionus plicatilis]|uniref:Vegetative incompatibility WD repeat n=1 Tax=Brachionus plicatilis TaxID=10195 RepID=A0A3M7RXR7_BRAPC|nr:vegetative incompatibility WD repeat [Brachionus plicatilis]